MNIDQLIDNLDFRFKNGKDVIPVVGYDLITVKDDKGNQIPFLDYLAIEIANDNRVDLSENKHFETDNFNYLIDKLAVNQVPADIIREKIIQIDPTRINLSAFENLARLFSFRYFINATFTNYLETSLTKIRGNVVTADFPYYHKNPRKPDDLKATKRSLNPSVYNIYGTIKEQYGFMISDDDILKLLIDINGNAGNLINLRSLLSESSLLFIGCKYSDWLFRFFLTSLKPKIIEEKVIPSPVIVDDFVSKSSVFFISKHKIAAVSDLSPENLIQELFESSRIKKVISPKSFLTNTSNLIFISYASENIDLALKVYDQLITNGFNAWLDRKQISLGNSIDDKVKDGINNSDKILILITSESEGKGQTNGTYLHMEWEFLKDIKTNRLEKQLIPVFSANRPINNTLNIDLNKVFGLRQNTLSAVLNDQDEFDEQTLQQLR